MPVKRYRSFEEASTDLWVMRPDEAYYKRVRQFMALWSKLSPLTPKRSLAKFRTIEEAEQRFTVDRSRFTTRGLSDD